jgi:3(or 17)beta-hydroxysteroid dehydrogenase
MRRVEGKVAIVTGAAMGLGAAHATTLAREGARVMLTDIDAAVGQATAASIPASQFLPLDVRDEAQWSHVVSQTVQTWGRLDILVNNAGLVRFANVEDCALEEFRLLNAVMCEGTFLGCKHAIPAMTRSGGGSIINTSSVAAIRGKGLIPAYTAAKGAIMALTLSVAAHCKERGNHIRCNVLLPGAHETPMAVAARRHFAAGPNNTSMASVHQGPIDGKPEEVADLVLFLASDESRTITGTSIVIDDGEILP